MTGFRGRIAKDPTKPNGMMRKLMDVSRLAHMGRHAQITLEARLSETYQWFLAHQATFRN